MKIFIALAIGFLFQADSIKNTNNIQITLKNNAIYFIENDPKNDAYNDSIKRKKSFNVVEVEFKNKGHEKMLLFINREELNFDFGYITNYFYHFQNIETGDSKPETSYALVTFSGTPKGLYNIENHKKYNRKLRNDILNLADNERRALEAFEKYAFYLGANETKTVYFHVNLPIVKEMSYEIQQNPSKYTNLKEGWEFKFVYEAYSKNIYNDLPEFVKEELRKNQIEIFDGKIVSNAVKLKKR